MNTQQDSPSDLLEKSKALQKSKLRELITIKLALQQMLKELLYEGNTREGKDVQKVN